MKSNTKHKSSKQSTKKVKALIALVCALVTIVGAKIALPQASQPSEQPSASVIELPAYSGSPSIVLDNNVPTFTEEDWTTTSFETYSELDELGRCGVGYACIGQDLMPTSDRESISSVYPSGWEQEKYDNVDGGYLYNRSHIIGFQLTGENANERNLITGTRAFNVEGMLPYEDEVAQYIHSTGNHVLYRVTPYYQGDNLVANGVQMEAFSVEDEGEGVQFNVYCYNAQPDIVIDYSTGNSYFDADYTTDESYTFPVENATDDNIDGAINDALQAVFDLLG